MITHEHKTVNVMTHANPQLCKPANDTKIYRSHLFRDANTCGRCGLAKPLIERMKARAKSGRSDEHGHMHFALIKSPDHDAKSGRQMNAMTAAKRLLDTGIWPIWENTPGRIVVAADDRVCIYLTGSGVIMATARIHTIQRWSRSFADSYPLVLGGIPELVLCSSDVVLADFPEPVINHIKQLNCVGKNKKKWGAAFCGGMRSLTKHDFHLLTHNFSNHTKQSAVK